MATPIIISSVFEDHSVQSGSNSELRESYSIAAEKLPKETIESNSPESDLPESELPESNLSKSDLLQDDLEIPLAVLVAATAPVQDRETHLSAKNSVAIDEPMLPSDSLPNRSKREAVAPRHSIETGVYIENREWSAGTPRSTDIRSASLKSSLPVALSNSKIAAKYPERPESGAADFLHNRSERPSAGLERTGATGNVVVREDGEERPNPDHGRAVGSARRQENLQPVLPGVIQTDAVSSDPRTLSPNLSPASGKEEFHPLPLAGKVNAKDREKALSPNSPQQFESQPAPPISGVHPGASFATPSLENNVRQHTRVSRTAIESAQPAQSAPTRARQTHSNTANLPQPLEHQAGSTPSVTTGFVETNTDLPQAYPSSLSRPASANTNPRNSLETSLSGLPRLTGLSDSTGTKNTSAFATYSAQATAQPTFDSALVSSNTGRAITTPSKPTSFVLPGSAPDQIVSTEVNRAAPPLSSSSPSFNLDNFANIDRVSIASVINAPFANLHAEARQTGVTTINPVKYAQPTNGTSQAHFPTTFPTTPSPFISASDFARINRISTNSATRAPDTAHPAETRLTNLKSANPLQFAQPTQPTEETERASSPAPSFSAPASDKVARAPATSTFHAPDIQPRSEARPVKLNSVNQVQPAQPTERKDHASSIAAPSPLPSFSSASASDKTTRAPATSTFHAPDIQPRGEARPVKLNSVNPLQPVQQPEIKNRAAFATLSSPAASTRHNPMTTSRTTLATASQTEKAPLPDAAFADSVALSTGSMEEFSGRPPLMSPVLSEATTDLTSVIPLTSEPATNHETQEASLFVSTLPMDAPSELPTATQPVSPSSSAEPDNTAPATLQSSKQQQQARAMAARDNKAVAPAETRFNFASWEQDASGNRQSVVISGSEEKGYVLTPSNEQVRQRLEQHEKPHHLSSGELPWKIDTVKSATDQQRHPRQHSHQNETNEE